MLRNEPQWYKDAIIYQLHVRAYHDSLGDGVGDFRGLTQKLDYVQDLGVTALWLLPFYPSPLRDDGYDIADYVNIHPDYGTLDMFREFLEAAHARGLRVITELVINHTSDQNPWFQRARRSPPGSPERDFYVWSDTPERYADARIIFKDFEVSNWTYDNVAKAYYWHRFYSHQPDLNYDNPEVRKAILPLVDFWFDMGVDGLRLDAVPYLYEREGTNCENLPETHEYLKSLRRHMDEHYPDRMLLAEANQWPEDAAAYFGNGDECHMAFHFPVMPRLYMAVHTEDRFPIVDILQQTPRIPDNCQWAIFLRNHDELTLEMVTDEERDYMYRAYAVERRARINLGIRRRLAPLLGNNRRRIELMNGLLFSLPGTPVIYYGDEIGMGDNIYLGDRNGVRTPMQWSADRNAGFSRANPQKLFLPIIIDPEYHYEAINVEAQQGNPSSLLWWHKRLMSLRQQHKAFSRGDVEFLDPHNRKILAFVRKHEDDRVLVVANLSRFVQFVELDLSAYEGIAPVELFGSTQFPAVGKLPYLLTLGPHAFYWFTLPSAAPEKVGGHADGVPVFHSLDAWEQLFDRTQSTRLANSLLLYWQRSRARGENPKTVRAVRLRDGFRFAHGEIVTRLVLADFEFKEGDPETCAIPFRFADEAAASQWPAGALPPLLARLVGARSGVIYDASTEPSAFRSMLDAVAERRMALGSHGGELQAWTTAAAEPPSLVEADALTITVQRSNQTNPSAAFGKRWILKRYQRIEEGVHPEVEIGRLLNVSSVDVKIAPVLVGGIDYRRRKTEPITLCVLHEYVVNDSDAWRFTLDVLDNLLEQLTGRPPEARHDPPAAGTLPDVHVDAHVRQLLDEYSDFADRLGARLALLHVLLAASDRPEFAPEPFSVQYQRSLYQTVRKQTLHSLDGLRAAAAADDDLRTLIEQVLARRSRLLERFQPLLSEAYGGRRIRGHGDFHLAQVLMSGRDFRFIDFEGVAGQALNERRIKRSPLRDVVGMLRSFDYAAQCALLGLGTDPDQPQGAIRAADRVALEPWLEYWRKHVSQRFLDAYLAAPGIAELIPPDPAERDQLLDVLSLEQMTVEIRHELRHRPKWLVIPLRSLLRTL